MQRVGKLTSTRSAESIENNRWPVLPFVAGLITRHTGRLLVISLVVVAGFGTAYQGWALWRDEPDQQVAEGTSGALGGESDRLSWNYATSSGLLHTDRIEGDRAVAVRSMSEHCQQLATVSTSAGTAGLGEQRLLARLGQAQPVRQVGDINIYEPADQPAMVIGVDRLRQRIVYWGFAAPTADHTWSCYSFDGFPAGSN